MGRTAREAQEYLTKVALSPTLTGGLIGGAGGALSGAGLGVIGRWLLNTPGSYWPTVGRGALLGGMLGAPVGAGAGHMYGRLSELIGSPEGQAARLEVDRQWYASKLTREERARILKGRAPADVPIRGPYTTSQDIVNAQIKNKDYTKLFGGLSQDQLRSYFAE